jgi:hypothetical protein
MRNRTVDRNSVRCLSSNRYFFMRCFKVLGSRTLIVENFRRKGKEGMWIGNALIL